MFANVIPMRKKLVLLFAQKDPFRLHPKRNPLKICYGSCGFQNGYPDSMFALCLGRRNYIEM